MPYAVDCGGYAENEPGYAVGELACDGGYRKTGDDPGFALSDVCCTEYGSYVGDVAGCQEGCCCCCGYVVGYSAFGSVYDPCAVGIGYAADIVVPYGFPVYCVVAPEYIRGSMPYC